MKPKKMPEADVQVIGRTCWTCAHVCYTSSDPGYSEYTPGNDFDLRCGKDYWEVDTCIDGQFEFGRKVASAERCDDFELHPSIPR